MPLEDNSTRRARNLDSLDYALMINNRNDMAMHICARLGLHENLELLISQGGDACGRDLLNRTPVHLAAKWGHFASLNVLLRAVHQQPDLMNLQDKNGNSVTYWAGFGGCIKCLELVVKSGGKLSLTNCDNKTPLMAAVTNGKEEVVKYILNNFNASDENMSKVDYINMKNVRGTSSLHFAAVNNRDTIIDLLIKEGGDVKIRDSYGSTPLHSAAYYGHPKVIVALLMSRELPVAERFAYVNSLETSGRSPLLCAVLGESEVCIKLLYHVGGLLSVPDDSGMTPLMAPCMNGQPKLAELVLEKFDERRERRSIVNYIHQKDVNGRTAVHHAAMNGYVKIIKLLIHHGGDRLCRDNEYKTPLHYAAEKGHIGVMQVLLAGLNPAEKAAFVNSCCFYKNSVMHFAVVSKCIKCIDLVYEAGGIMSRGSYNGWTPLIAAAREGSHEVVRHLMKIFEKNREGMTRIEYIDKKDDGGRTAMHYAAAFGHRFVFECLMDEGGNTKCRNIKGTTPSDLAAVRIEILEEDRDRKRRKLDDKERRRDSMLYALFPISKMNEIRQDPTTATQILAVAKARNKTKYAPTIESFLRKYSKQHFLRVGLGLIPI